MNPNHPHHPADESIRHELAHVLLEHEPKQLFDNNGVRIWHDCDEAQADYLTCALAIPSPELLGMLTVHDGDVVALAAHFDADLAIIAERVEHLGAETEAIGSTLTSKGDPMPGPTLRRLRRRLATSEDGGAPTRAGGAEWSELRPGA